MTSEITEQMQPTPDGDVRERVARALARRVGVERSFDIEADFECGIVRSFTRHADAALSAIRPGDELPGTPETGPLVVVPKTITEAMETAHFEAHAKAKTIFADVQDVWASMLAAVKEATR